MTMAEWLAGSLIAVGFFVAALVSRLFKRPLTGVIIGGVLGMAVSVLILIYVLSGPSPTPF